MHASIVLPDCGKNAEAIEELKAATRLDPASPDLLSRLGFFYLMDRQYEKADKEFKNAIALEPAILSARKGLVLVYEQQRKCRDAIAELSDFLASSRHPDRARRVTEIYGKDGYEQAIQCVMHEEIKDDFEENAKPFYLAADYARLGDKLLFRCWRK
jgi:tetratricopeptide (TPR) repeat protein